MRSISKLLLTTLFALLMTTSAFAQSNDWLMGTWQLSYDPDGDPTDKLVFKPGNAFTNITANGKSLNGKYEVNNGRVKVVLEKQGKPYMAFFLGFEKSRDSLHFYSESTKKTSVYKKR